MRLRIASIALLVSTLVSSCTVIGNILGLLGFSTVVRDDARARGVSKALETLEAPYVEALSIGTADAFAFSYDFDGGHWNTPMYESGGDNNDESAVLMTSSLTFRRGYTENGSYNRGNLPGTIDIFFFDNAMHMLRIGDYWYADSDRGIENEAIRWCKHFYVDTEEVEHEFHGFDVVFVNAALVDRPIFLNGVLPTADQETDLSDSELALLESIDHQVRWLDTTDSKVIIPMAPIEVGEGGTVEVSVSLDDIIARIEFDPEVNGEGNPGKVVWNLGYTGAPLDYEIALIP